ncbi:MAG: glycosyltransferase family 2 protein [Flavobacteriales bacterium]|nr:glycosyltransferase family 2 protein [Flavobacteriales bacterium]
MNQPGQSVSFKVCIVLPCRDEQGVVISSARVLLSELDSLQAAGLAHPESYLCCVDDGSRDGTWMEIAQLAAETGRVRGIKLSARFGHPNALIAGLFTNRSQADILITIDADLQDDHAVLRAMLEHHRMGKRVVYGVRVDRKVDGGLKRLLASIFYRVMHAIDHRAVRDHADFRSADSGVIADLERFGEVNLYLRGLFPLIGYPSAEVHFTRQARHAGQSKYSYLKLAGLAWQGITSFSTAPLRMVFVGGLLMSLLAIALGAWVVAARLTGNPIEGWASIALLLLTFSSINLISLGIIGEYVGKIYQEVKQRPRYIIEATV